MINLATINHIIKCIKKIIIAELVELRISTLPSVPNPFSSYVWWVGSGNESNCDQTLLAQCYIC